MGVLRPSRRIARKWIRGEGEGEDVDEKKGSRGRDGERE